MRVKALNIDAVAAKIKGLDLSKAARKGQNRATQRIKPQISTAVRNEAALKKAYVDKLISVAKSESDSGFSVSFKMQKRGILLRNYRHSYNAKTKTLRIMLKPGQWKTIPKAFMFNLAKNGNGLTPVWRVNKGRYSFALYGMSPSQVFNTLLDRGDLKQVAVEIYRTEVLRVINE